jgi:regulator of protease activity HflC (stomatin/prohibitin superfamily)
VARDVVVFGLVLLLILAVVGLLAYALSLRNFILALITLLILAVLYIAWKTDVIVELKEYERAVVFRFGKYVGTRGPGWIVLLPFIEEYRLVDLRVQTLDVPKQEVVTGDNVVLVIDAVIYLRVVDPAKAVLKVDNYKQASVLFVQAMIRDLVGGMTLEEVINNIEELNKKIETELSKMAQDWGVKVVSVQIKSVEIPERVKHAMHDMMVAEKEKRARTERALAKKIELEAVKEAVEDMNDKVLLYFYLEALKEMAAGRSTKIIFPLDLTTLARAISERLGGVVPPEKVEADLLKNRGLVEKLLKELVEKKS